MKLLYAIKNLGLNRQLALLLFTLGFLALFAGDPYGGGKQSIDARELAMIVEKQVDHIAAADLADWILQGRADYRLIDLRTEAEFTEYAIPTAENIPLPGLIEAELPRSEKIVLYSQGGIHSAQAWFLLKAHGYKSVYMLFGGLDEWKEKVLFPALPENASPAQRADFARAAEVSKFFGGSPQSGTTAAVSASQPAMPKPSLPAGSTAAPRPGGKKKKEGC